MRLRQFTPRQPLPDIPVTQRDWQPDPEVVITHDDLYARAWECEYDEPIFDTDHNNLAVPNPPETMVRSEPTADELRNTPGIIPENSPEIIPQPDESYNGIDVDHDTQPLADTTVEQLDPMPTNPRSSKYDLRHNPKPNCNDDYRYSLCPATLSGKSTYIFEELRECVMQPANTPFQAPKWPPRVTTEHYRQGYTNFGT